MIYKRNNNNLIFYYLYSDICHDGKIKSNREKSCKLKYNLFKDKLYLKSVEHSGWIKLKKKDTSSKVIEYINLLKSNYQIL